LFSQATLTLHYLTITNLIYEILPVIKELNEVVSKTEGRVEGNLFYSNRREISNSSAVSKKEANKRDLLSAIVASLEPGGNVMEIGFNAGHSAALILQSNKGVNYYAFDLCKHAYTRPAYRVLTEFFKNRQLSLVCGDSTKTVISAEKKMKGQFSIIHVDGGHSFRVAYADMLNSHALSAKQNVVIIDDINILGVRRAWELMIKRGYAKRLGYGDSNTFAKRRGLPPDPKYVSAYGTYIH